MLYIIDVVVKYVNQKTMFDIYNILCYSNKAILNQTNTMTQEQQDNTQSQIDELTRIVNEQNENFVALQLTVTNLNSQLQSPTIIDPIKQEYIELYSKFVKDAEDKILYYIEVASSTTQSLRLNILQKIISHPYVLTPIVLTTTSLILVLVMYFTTTPQSHVDNSWFVITGTFFYIPVITSFISFILSNSVAATDKNLKTEEAMNLIQTKLAIKEVADAQRIAFEAFTEKERLAREAFTEKERVARENFSEKERLAREASLEKLQKEIDKCQKKS